MTPIERLNQSKQELSKAELAAAEYILETPVAVMQYTLTELAKKSHSSTAAIIRMCQRIGYDGFKEFKFSMSRCLLSNAPHPAEHSDLLPEAEDNTNSLDYIANAYIRYIAIMRQSIDIGQVRELARQICHARRIVVFGVNRTGFSAQQFSIRLCQLGIASQPITDPMVMTNYASIFGEGELCMIFTIRGRGSGSYKEYMQTMRSQGCYVALLTMAPKLNLIKYADISFVLPRISKTPDLSFLDDQAIFFIFIEVLLREISQYEFTG